jgi:ribosomal peptide maturation radical SAM protein 1
VTPFLEYCYRQLMATKPSVVAFSCMFFQTMPSLALGRMIRERHPEIKLAYGGATFHGEMGEEIFAKTPWIDAMSIGEADDVIVPLLRTLANGEQPVGLQGILTRDADGQAVLGAPAHPMGSEQLDALPDPDYDEFFADARAVGLMNGEQWLDKAAILFEGSRGCWWGEKKHCTFCGLNSSGMAFRVKQPERVFETLQRMSARYPVRTLWATDNIMSMSYFKTLLPKLAETPLQSRGRPVELFYEIKANLTRSHVKALADARVNQVQPGIESLSTHLLQVMDKGVTALQNVWLLKCATEYELTVVWNMLIRVPREEAADYEQMVAWIPRLHHLHPPTGGAPRIECHRFSPYHFRTGQFCEDVTPAPWYRGLYPEDQFNLDRIAYYFDVKWKDTLGDPAYDPFQHTLQHWMQLWREPEIPHLTLRELDDGGLEIEDTRDKPKQWRLEPAEARLYKLITDIATPAKIHTQLLAQSADNLQQEEIRARLKLFVEQGLALQENDHFLGLALPPFKSAAHHVRKMIIPDWRACSGEDTVVSMATRRKKRLALVSGS